MIRKEQRRVVVICDGPNCGLVFPSKITDWRRFNYAACWKEAQGGGWTARKAPGAKDWKHFCGDCGKL
jgi:hypothetical protein